MKLYNLKDINGFFDIVNTCKGKVFIVSSEGDRLNLKSTLTQYIAFSNLFSNPDIAELELEVENSDDIKRFLDFMINERITNE